MTLLKLCLSATAAAALALSLSSVASAGTVNIGKDTGPQEFFITNGTPFTPSITALFFDTVKGSDVSFTDTYNFIIPQTGVGSGSLSTSFSSKSNELSISDVIIDGVSYTAAEAAAGIGGIPITAFDENSIVVQGKTAIGNSAAFYSGTATFTSAAPEPAAWLLMIGGIGFAGAALRRRQTAVQFA